MIIVVLATIGLTSYSSANRRSRDARRAADLEQLRSALEMYRADNNRYPPGASLVPLVPNYINILPRDPRTNVPYTYQAYTNTALTNTCSGAQVCIAYGLCSISYEATPPTGYIHSSCVSSTKYFVRNP
jgi:type II secretory pathway pseudopilin PulG